MQKDRARRIHDRSYIVHSFIHRRQNFETIRESSAAFFERDDARKRRKFTKSTGEMRLLPANLDIRNKPGKENEIDLAFAKDLVRDMRVPLRVSRSGAKLEVWGAP